MSRNAACGAAPPPQLVSATTFGAPGRPLLSQLEPRSDVIRDLLNSGIQADFFCYSSGTTDTPPSLPASIRERAGQLEFTIGEHDLIPGAPPTPPKHLDPGQQRLLRALVDNDAIWENIDRNGRANVALRMAGLPSERGAVAALIDPA